MNDKRGEQEQMANTVIGLFDEASDARKAVQELTGAGFDRDRIDITTAEVSGDDAGGDGQTYGNEGFTDSVGNFFTSLFGGTTARGRATIETRSGRHARASTTRASGRERRRLSTRGAIDVESACADATGRRRPRPPGGGFRSGRDPVVEEELPGGKRVGQGGVRCAARRGRRGVGACAGRIRVSAAR